ncbi:MAG: DMT family transporter [Anaerovoracaceae bacterium]
MERKVYIYIVLAAFLFGTMEVALKIGGSDLDPLQLTFVRFLIGGFVILPLAYKEAKTNNIKLDFHQFCYLTALGILCIPVSMLLFQFGILNSNASTASVLISINPIFTMIFAHFMVNEKLTKGKFISMCVGFAGTIFMIKPWDMQEGNTVIGIIYMILAALTFGLYTVLGKKSVKKVGIMVQTSVSFITGSFVLLIIMLFMGKPVFAGLAEHIWLVGYVGVFVTGIGYWAYFIALKYSDAGTASIAFFIKPAIAPVMAVLFMHDIILWNTYVGIGLVLLASFINIREGKKKNVISEQNKNKIKE